MEKEQIFDLTGKVCVITGAGGALGSALAEGLAARDVSIAAVDINRTLVDTVVERIRTAGGKALGFCCDVLDEDGLNKVLTETVSQFGEPDFLINGAGGNRPSSSTEEEYYSENASGSTFLDLSFEGMKEAFELNFFGTLLPSKVFSGPMLLKRSGSIINIASVSAINPLSRVITYSAAKAAIVNFTKWLAVHYSKSNVRVNAIAPGFIMTEQLKFLHLDKDGNYTQRAEKVVRHTPVERYGEREELLGAVIWLLSEASSFTTGSVVAIDGGFSSYTI